MSMPLSSISLLSWAVALSRSSETLAMCSRMMVSTWSISSCSTDDPKNNVDGKQGVGYSLKAAFHDALGLEAVYFQSLFENRARVVVVAVAVCAYCCLCFCH